MLYILMLFGIGAAHLCFVRPVAWQQALCLSNRKKLLSLSISLSNLLQSSLSCLQEVECFFFWPTVNMALFFFKL